MPGYKDDSSIMTVVHIYQHGCDATLAQFLKGVAHVGGVSGPVPY